MNWPATSKLTQEDVNNLMKKYKISSFSALAAGGLPAISPPPKHIVVYEHTLENGLFFPLSSFLSSTLSLLGVSPGLLLPNSVKILVGFELLCFYHNIPCNPHNFLQLFRLIRVGRYFYFIPRPNSPRIYCYNLTGPEKEWKDRFFFLEYDMGDYPEKPLNHEILEEYQLHREHPDVHFKFQASRMIHLSKGWNNSLVRDYLMLAQESAFTDYSWPSESERLRVLNRWRIGFEQRSESRKKDDQRFSAEVVGSPVGMSVGETNARQASSTKGKGEFPESSKRCFSKAALEEETGEPASARPKIHTCSNISNYDAEGHNVEPDGVSGRMLSGGLARTPITPLGTNYFPQNMPAVGGSPPKDLTSLAAYMGEMTSMFLSSAMEHEEKLKEALHAKTAECQTWEEKFNVSHKHEQKLSAQAEEKQKQLSKCLNEQMVSLSKQKEYEKLLENQASDLKVFKENLALVKEALAAKTAECQAWRDKFNLSQNEHEQTRVKQEEYNQELQTCLNEHKLASSKQKEYEKLLESESRILKENLAEMKEALDVRTAECEEWQKEFYKSQEAHVQKLSLLEDEYNQAYYEKYLHDHALSVSKEQRYEKLLEEQRSDLKILKEQKEAVETALKEMKASYANIFTHYEERARSLQRK